MKTISFHNPDGLSPEKVGEGFRLLESDETVGTEDQFWSVDSAVEAGGYWKEAFHTRGMKAGQCEFTFRHPHTQGTPMTPEPPAAVAEHNPEKLTQEVLGKGWRFLTSEEVFRPLPEGAEWMSFTGWKPCTVEGGHGHRRIHHNLSYRFPLSPDDQSASGSSVWKRGASFGEKPDGTYWFSVADGLGRHFQHDTELPIWALKQLTTQDAKESVLSPPALPLRSDTKDTEIVALRQVYEALQRVAIGGSRRRVCEAALVLLGDT